MDVTRVGAIAAALLLATCAGDQDSAGRGSSGTSVVRFETQEGSAELAVRVASTKAERAEGLMGVEQVPADEGMAFVYGEPTTATFWMKDTPIPLSIAFVDEDGRVIAIRDMEPCVADPCPSYGADGPFVLAIEANLGWFDDAGVDVGSRAELREEEPLDG